MTTTLFKEVGYTLSKLNDGIEMGEIGLPDIQRFFTPSVSIVSPIQFPRETS